MSTTDPTLLSAAAEHHDARRLAEAEQSLRQFLENQPARRHHLDDKIRNDLPVASRHGGRGKTIFANESFKLKRVKAGARGRYKPRVKRFSSVTVILDERIE